MARLPRKLYPSTVHSKAGLVDVVGVLLLSSLMLLIVLLQLVLLPVLLLVMLMA